MDSDSQSVRILVVDDDSSLARSTSLVFQVLGYSAVIETDSQVALTRMSEDRFDGLITDVTMPGMDGVELAKRGKQIWPEMFVIFVTGNSKTIPTEAETVAAAVLTKPFAIDQLKSAIQASIAGDP